MMPAQLVTRAVAVSPNALPQLFCFGNEFIAGQPLEILSDDVIAKVQTPSANDRHRGQRDLLYFEAMMRVLDRELPGYAE